MNVKEWKYIDIEYGNSSFRIKVPSWCNILKMRHVPALVNPQEQISYSLSHPIGSPPIGQIISSIKKPLRNVNVAIAVADNTRPVPYSGEREDGILLPLLKVLKSAGIKNDKITIIVATGTHMPTSRLWKERAFGSYIVDHYEITDHDCTSPDLCFLDTFDGAQVRINKDFVNADIRIVTGLVEPHFMAGFSGGRKVVCPGLVNLETTHLFHSSEYMDNPSATNLILQDNPCHSFSLKVAEKVGVHFSINVVLNDEMKLANVFAGDLVKAHLEAVDMVRRYSSIPVDHEYDIVITHGGKVAVNHYQAAKAAYCTIPIIREGGTVILVAWNGDEESIGKDEYKRVIGVLMEKGPGEFTEFIKSDRWQFVPDQWQVQKWDQFFKKVGSFDRLVYCTTGINPEDMKKLPGKSGYELEQGKAVPIEEIVQKAVYDALEKADRSIVHPTIAFVKEGPYAILVRN